MAGKAKVGKVDVDENPLVASRFQISSIPALMVFKNGQVVESAIGARPKAAIAALVTKHVE
jgi:thioredoxin 1